MRCLLYSTKTTRTCDGYGPGIYEEKCSNAAENFKRVLEGTVTLKIGKTLTFLIWDKFLLLLRSNVTADK
jgi:hypothetical protein